jgi:hypothetical protein
MIERVEIRRDEIDARWQRQTANILLQKADTFAAAIAPRLPQHVARSINRKHRHPPRAIQVTCEQSRAAPDVGRGAKANPVPSHQPFEGIPDAQKKREADRAIVNRRDAAVWRRYRARAGRPDEVNVA